MKKMLSLMLALSMVLALAACGSSGGGTPSTSGTTPSNSGSPSTSQPQQMPSSGGALRLALSTNDGSTKDDRVPTPWLNHNMATNLMWRGLLIADSTLTKTSPDLAEKVEISDDGLTYTITLKEGLKWSDGEALTVDDVL